MGSLEKPAQASDGPPTPAAEGVSDVSGAKQKTNQAQRAAVSGNAPAQVASRTTVPPLCIAAQNSWARLVAGNDRFAGNCMEHPNQSSLRRQEVARRQQPFAVVLACSDSRVAPEIVFDAGLGDLFVIRVAGNTAGQAAIGSMEFAVEQLRVPLIVVLGHERCAAVQTAIEALDGRKVRTGYLGEVIDPILPAVRTVAEQGGDRMERAVQLNILRVVSQLRASQPILTKAIRDGRLSIIGARYGMDDGRVTVVE